MSKVEESKLEDSFVDDEIVIDDEIFIGPVSSKELRRIELINNLKKDQNNCVNFSNLDDTVPMSDFGDVSVTESETNGMSTDCDYEIAPTSTQYDEIEIIVDSANDNSCLEVLPQEPTTFSALSGEINSNFNSCNSPEDIASSISDSKSSSLTCYPALPDSTEDTLSTLEYPITDFSGLSEKNNLESTIDSLNDHDFVEFIPENNNSSGLQEQQSLTKMDTTPSPCKVIGSTFEESDEKLNCSINSLHGSDHKNLLTDNEKKCSISDKSVNSNSSKIEEQHSPIINDAEISTVNVEFPMEIIKTFPEVIEQNINCPVVSLSDSDEESQSPDKKEYCSGSPQSIGINSNGEEELHNLIENNDQIIGETTNLLSKDLDSTIDNVEDQKINCSGEILSSVINENLAKDDQEYKGESTNFRDDEPVVMIDSEIKYEDKNICKVESQAPCSKNFKIYSPIKGRLSYFSSLDTINVDNSKLYGSFIAEEEEEVNGSNISAQKHEVKEKGLDDSLNCSLMTSFGSEHSKSSCEEFVNRQNVGMMESNTLSIGYSDKTNSIKESHITNNGVANLNVSNASSVGPQLPQRVFNDTIEEMELMLKYGEKYFQEMQNTELVSMEDTIVSPLKKSSICSTITNFDPNLDSTRNSNDILKKFDNSVEIEASQMVDIHQSKGNGTPKKSTAPPKPPRNVICKPIEKASFSPEKCSFISKAPNSSGHSQNRTKPLFQNNPKLASGIPKFSLTPSKANFVTGHSTQSSVTPTLPSRIHTTPKKDSKIILASKKFISQSARPSSQKVSSRIQAPYTPQGKATKPLPRSASKSVNAFAKKVAASESARPSPVAKYLQNNPPPPLITNVKARCKISPMKLQLTASPALPKSHFGNGSTFSERLNGSAMQRQETIRGIDAKMNELTNKLNSLQASGQTYDDGLDTPQMEPSKKKVKAVLPFSSYYSGKSLKLEEKENVDRRRDIPTDKPPASVTKHIGRVKIPKNEATDHPTRTDKSRVSMMEVSLYEPHTVLHTNTIASSIKRNI